MPRAPRVSNPVRASLVGLAVVALGCGSGDQMSTAPVTGTVTYDGQPVTGGSVTFAPVASGEAGGVSGKPAAGDVGSDGKYALSTYGDGDGAVVGKHRVIYSAPTVEAAPLAPGAAHGQAPKPSPYAGKAAKPSEVEVKDGSNDVAIELVKP